MKRGEEGWRGVKRGGEAEGGRVCSHICVFMCMYIDLC